MANEMGYVLEIPDNILNKLDEFDKKLERIALASETTAKNVTDAFSQMANGVNPLSDAMSRLSSSMNAFTSSNIIQNVNSLSQGFTQTNQVGESLSQTLAKISTSLNDLSNSASKVGEQDPLKDMEAKTKALKDYQLSSMVVSQDREKIERQVEQSIRQESEQTQQQYLRDLDVKTKAAQQYQERQAQILKLQSDAERRANEQKLSTTQGAIDYASEAKSINDRTMAIQYLTKARNNLSSADSNYTNKLIDLNEWIAKLNDANKDAVSTEINKRKAADESAKAAQRQADATRKLLEAQKAQDPNKLYADAIKAANASNTSINQQIAAMKQLKQARAALSSEDSNYKEKLGRLNAEMRNLKQKMDESTVSSNKLKSSHRGLMDISGQLARQLALVFSVSQIQGYISKLIEIRGEFELQQRSLQSILQNKDKADEIWNKTVQLAVRSPFRVKELVTYTKQLAAYRVEADKLYDTNKMLADVSAGLGVDMQRLILAFGQVKAANYLRGTELRQFSEAGINILGELSKYFTEMKGQAVSVGDVFEMVSKRMVSFTDVEEIFKRITSAGGIFYNMQEIQAETLKGQVSNLYDQLDLMFNEIGKGNDGVLKGTVQLIKEMIINWRTFADLIVAGFTGWSTYMVAMVVFQQKFGLYYKVMNALMAFGYSFRSKEILQNQIIASQAAEKLALEQGNTAEMSKQVAYQMRLKQAQTIGMGHWAIIAAAVAAVGMYIYKAYEDSQKLNKELAGIQAQGVFDASSSTANFKRLADIVRDTSKSYKEQKDALDELKRTYGDILPSHMLEMNTIKQMKGNYDEATDAIYNYVQAKTRQKQIEAISEEQGAKVTANAQTLAENIAEWGTQNYLANISAQNILPVLAKLKEGFDNGSISVNNYKESLMELLKEYTGKDFSGAFKSTEDVFGGEQNLRLIALDKYYNSVQEYGKKIAEADSFNVLNFGNLVDKKLQAYENLYRNTANAAIEALNVLRSAGSGEPVTEEQIQKAEATLNGFYGRMKLNIPEWREIMNQPFLIEEQTMAINRASVDSFISFLRSKMNQGVFNQEDLTSVQAYIEKTQNMFNQADFTPLQKKVNGVIREFARVNHISFSGLDQAMAKSDESTTEYVDRMGDLLKTLQLQLISATTVGSLSFGTMTNDQIKNTKNLINLLEEIQKKNTFSTKPSSSSKKETDYNKMRLDGIKQANTEYEKLIKYYDKETAKALVLKNMYATLREAKMSDAQIKAMNFTDKGTIDSMEKYLAMYGKGMSKETRLAFQKSIADLKGQIQIDIVTKNLEEVKNKIEDSIGNYEVSIELSKMGFSDTQIEQMFGITPMTIQDIKETLNKAFLDTMNENEKIAAKSEKRTAKNYTSMEQARLAGGNEEVFKAYDERNKKIEDLERKHLQQMAKDYKEYYLYQFGEATKIEIDYANKVNDIQELMAKKLLSSQEGTMAIGGLQKEKQAKLDELKWTDFKNTDLYIKLFEDLDYVSTSTLEALKANLEEMRKGLNQLNPEQLKQVTEQLNKVDEAITARNPFKTFKANIGDAIKAIKQIPKLEINAIASRADLTKQKEIVAGLETEVALRKKKDKNGKYTIELTDDELEKLKATLLVQKDILANKEAQNKKDETALTKSEKAKKDIASAMDKGSEYTKTISSGGRALVESIQNAVGAFSEGMQDTLDSIFTVIDGITEVEDGISLIMKGKPLTGVFQMLTGIFDTIGGFFGLGGGDKAKERQIKKETELVEQLQKSYEKLKTAIDDAYSMDTLTESTKMARESLSQQISATEEMIRLEESKKRTDKDKIKGWKDNIEEYKDALKELSDTQAEALGAFGSEANVKSAAEEFVSAWTDAYNETGNGLDSLKEKMNDFINNAVKKQLLLKLSQQYVTPLLESFDKMFDESSPMGGTMTTEELEAWKKMYVEYSKMFNEKAQAYMQALNIKPTGTTELDSLSQGISSVTEQTAQAIEAYLNSMRFFLAQQQSDVAQIKMMLGANGEGGDNAVLTELKSQTMLISKINTFLTSIGAQGHSLGGAGIKVFIS